MNDGNDRPQLVIVGDPVDGFAYYGPFADADEATEWAEQEVTEQSWWLADLRGRDE